ncbi:hypothetical protein ABPG75_010680 [Micractinium tetrahymenae]
MGSTETFLNDFFPAAADALKQRAQLWRLLQPAWLATACPEQQLVLTLPGWLGGGGATLLLRNPSLLPAQLGGLAVALFGVHRLRGPRHVYLHHSLVLFGLMNASSILAHAFAQRGTPLWQAALKADIAFTGASSLCLLLSQLLPAPASLHAASGAAVACWGVLLALLAAVFRWSAVPWVPEAAYLGTTALAATATGYSLLRRWAALSRRQRGALWPRYALGALGAAAMLCCLALDSLLCAVGGPWLGTTPLLFAGSAAGFAAIVLLAGGDGEGAAGAGGGGRSKAD